MQPKAIIAVPFNLQHSLEYGITSVVLVSRLLKFYFICDMALKMLHITLCGCVYTRYVITSIRDMADVKISPLADRLVVRPDKNETKTSTGIILPDNAKEKPQKGVVVAVGPGKKDEPMVVKIGDHILYSKYGGTEIKQNNEEYLIMRESDVYAVISE